ncbi:hypothetical protein L7F22_004278 [Adiantum nelumboides]|nr:hypothetical protein [Adiantum nelumboides]
MAFLVSGRDDEATKLRAFPLVLREGAKAWYQTLAPEERRDWETLKTAFIEEFRHQEPPEEIWRQLLELRQTSPNDYRSYEGKFSNLWEKWCASLGEGERAPECLKKDCFLAGLYPILREKVKVKFPDTFEKAMAYAREKDRKLKFQAQLQGGMEPPLPAQPIARTVAGTSATDQESSQQELLQQITNQLESLSINLVQGVRAPQSGTDRNRQEGQRQTQEYVCYNCGEMGHGMYFCPHPRRYQGNGTLENGLFVLDRYEKQIQACIAKTKTQATQDAELWHARFGHVGYGSLMTLRRHNMVHDLSLLEMPPRHVCEGCVLGKMHRFAFSQDGSVRATRKLQLVHSDVCGPMRTPSVGNCLYFVTFIDDFSRFC